MGLAVCGELGPRGDPGTVHHFIDWENHLIRVAEVALPIEKWPLPGLGHRMQQRCMADAQNLGNLQRHHAECQAGRRGFHGDRPV